MQIKQCLLLIFKFPQYCSQVYLYLICLQDAKSFKNIDDLESFMLKHSENIVDMMGGEIDRIEQKLRVSSKFYCVLPISPVPTLFSPETQPPPT